MAQNARIGRKYTPVINQLNVARISLKEQGIADWQNAINSARNVLMPRRKRLYELYANLQFDPHLHAVINKRVGNVLNKDVVWVQDGMPEALEDRIKEDVLRTPWFYDFIRHSMDVVPYGPTILELEPVDGLIGKCNIVPRENVVPERGYIVEDAANVDLPWIHYRDDPYYSDYLIEVGDPRDLGTLLIALPMVMYKRNSFGDWSQFTELFGIPFRVGKYNPYDHNARQLLMDALSEMGAAGHAVIPEGTEIEFHQVSAGQSQSGIFKDMVEQCDAQMSKLFLGNTLTTQQGENGARSLGEVHLDVEENIALMDMRRIEFLLNWELKDRLVRLGYPLGNGKFAFDRTRALPLEKRIDLDIKVGNKIPIPDEYWYNTYGVPKPGSGPTPVDDPPEDPQNDPPEDPPTDPPAPPAKGEKKKQRTAASAALTRELDQLYAHGHTHRDAASTDPVGSGAPDNILEELAKAMHDGRLRDGWVDPELMQWTAGKLLEGVTGGMQIDDTAEPQAEQLHSFLQRNVMVFSGFKTYKTLRAATDELVDEDGNFRSFADFKRRVLEIDQLYNVNYLRAEYQHAVAAGQMALRWQDIQRDKDLFPNLTFRTVGDDRVRPSHAKLDGTTKPVDDPFWDVYYPPIAWGCRCDVDQNDDPTTAVDEELLPRLPVMFRNNVGKTGVVFPPNHPYARGASKKVKKEVEDAVNKVIGKPPADGLRPIGKPVSGALNVKLRGKMGKAAQEVMDVIDHIHGDGVLHEIPVGSGGRLKSGTLGMYRHYPTRGYDIRVKDIPEMPTVLIHEIGHFLDHIGIGKGHFDSAYVRTHTGPVMEAAERSRNIKNMRAVLAKGKLKDKEGIERPLTRRLHRYIGDYLLSGSEMWARMYAQYIVRKSGRKDWLDMLEGKAQSTSLEGQVPTQWDAEDFNAIEKEIDKMFVKLGWRI